MRTPFAVAFVAVGLGACGQPARAGDATVDAVPEGGDAVFDAGSDADAAVDSVVLVTDADLDVFTACDADTTAPAGLGRSCAPGTGVDPRYCAEAHYCGGVFTMGTGGFEPEGATFQPIAACDVHPAVAHSGFVDTYEVTVARFRQWMLAGMPHPAVGEVFFNGLQWTADLDGHLTPPDHEDRTGRSDRCTYTMVPGANDERPVTCATLADAIAFCWWDGKHLATEVGWEYVARNHGTTDTILGDNAAQWLTGTQECAFGDVEGTDGTCGNETVPQYVGTHPLGDRGDPAWISDLFGSVREMTLGLASPYNTSGHDASGACTPGTGPAPLSLDGDFVQYVDRGASWLDDAVSLPYWAHSATREPTSGSGAGSQDAQTADEGIRCMRWEQEPR